MSEYYMLLADDAINIGDVVPTIGDDGRPNPVVTDPRAVPITESLDGRAQDGLVDIIHGDTPAVRVALVMPEGDVRPHAEIWNVDDPDIKVDGTTELEAEGGWRISSIEPLHTILGPQGELILAAVQQGILAFEDEDPKMTTAAEAYCDEVDRLHESPGTSALHAAQHAASMALADVGADTYWWESAVGCVWGTEIIALAARDLLGTAEGWDQDAYDLLTGSWRGAFSHLLHPKDAPLARSNAQQ